MARLARWASRKRDIVLVYSFSCFRPFYFLVKSCGLFSSLIGCTVHCTGKFFKLRISSNCKSVNIGWFTSTLYYSPPPSCPADAKLGMSAFCVLQSQPLLSPRDQWRSTKLHFSCTPALTMSRVKFRQFWPIDAFREQTFVMEWHENTDGAIAREMGTKKMKKESPIQNHLRIAFPVKIVWRPPDWKGKQLKDKSPKVS